MKGPTMKTLLLALAALLTALPSMACDDDHGHRQRHQPPPNVCDQPNSCQTHAY